LVEGIDASTMDVSNSIGTFVLKLKLCSLEFIVMTFLVRECYGSPKISIKFVKIHQNLLKFMPEECYDKVLNEEF
jgi:hypothetical protein